MRILAPTLLLALLFCSTTAWAQNAKHPLNADAKPHGTMSISLAVPSATAPTGKHASAQANDVIMILISVFVIDNKTDLVLDLQSITFNCEDDWVDNTPTATIFDLITHTALSQALTDGHISCPTNCGLNEKITRVIFPSCVKRIGAGRETRFSNCVPGNFCFREYIVCCPNGSEAPQYVNVRNTSPGCYPDGGGVGCAATCPE
jgi:hypothetical protein